VSFRQLTFINETVKQFAKSCAKFDLLFVNMQCTMACLFEKLNYKVSTTVSVEPYQLFQ